jgi:hypothetical protein
MSMSLSYFITTLYGQYGPGLMWLTHPLALYSVAGLLVLVGCGMTFLK